MFSTQKHACTVKLLMRC